jgi:hypothetical protein
MMIFTRLVMTVATSKVSSKVDAQRPSTWLYYRSGMCEGCAAGCCTLPVEVTAKDLVRTAKDLVRLELASEFELELSLKKLANRLIKEKYVKSFNGRTGIFTLDQGNGDDCCSQQSDKRCLVCRMPAA